MPNVNLTSPQQQQQQPHYQMGTNGLYASTNNTTTNIGSKYSIIENNNHSQNGLDSHNNTNLDESGGCGSAKRSFIQQRVERLYGPGALAQGFYSPKKIRDSTSRLNKSDVTDNGRGGGGGVNGGGAATSELARKFQELSPSKDYNQFRKKLSTNGRPPAVSPNLAENIKADNNNIDLPCLRHLSQEFRAQLPVVSPKRNFSRISPGRETTQPKTNTTATATINGTNHTITSPPTFTNKQIEQIEQIEQQHQQTETLKTSSPITASDELDRKVVVSAKDNEILLISSDIFPILDEPKVVLPIFVTQKSHSSVSTNEGLNDASTPEKPTTTTTTNGSVTTKDAHFFLKQLKDEQNRLLIMAAEVEKYLDALASNPDITEDTLGLLRSASGKARLLVSQKMKQFEGLCHTNLNSSPEDKFPTTVDDLQGFWDMVYLQVDHIDSIFADIENLKKNDWKKPIEDETAVNLTKTPRNNKTPLAAKSKLSTPMTNGAALAATPSAAALKREAQRKKLQEMKRRNREALAAASANTNSTTETSPIEIIGVNINTEQTS